MRRDAFAASAPRRGGKRRPHGPAYAGLHQLPRAAGQVRPRRLLPPPGGQTCRLFVPAAAQLPGRSAPVRAHARAASHPERRLFARDRRLFFQPRRPLPAAGRPACRPRRAGAGQGAGLARRPRLAAAGLHPVPRHGAHRRATPHARPAGPAARLPECAVRRLANWATQSAGTRLHGAHCAKAERR